MPAAVVWAVSAIGAALGGTVGAFLVMNATAVATAAMLAGGLAYSASQKRKAERLARAQYNAAQVDRLANVVTTVAPRELVLGRVRKGGPVFFRASTDTNNTRFVMCIALAAHEIDAVEQIYLNDVPVTLDGSGYVTTAPYAITRLESAQETFAGSSIVLANVPVASSVKVTRADASAGGDYGAQYATTIVAHSLAGSTVTIGDSLGGTVSYQYNVTPSKARITTYLGTAGQTADAGLVSDFPTLWSSAHRARGVAYLKCEFWYDETAFPSGLPTVSAVIRGARCYDPRSGTTVWSENPAILARHILTHAQFGKRSSLTAAEDARITTAANACDAATVYTVGGVAQPSRALYKAALVVPFGTTARDALDDLVQAMAGQWAYSAGEMHIRAGSYTASVQTLTDADLAVVQRGADGSVQQQPVQIVTHRARDQQFNVVTATVWDEAKDYKQTTLTPLKSSALITRDGAELVQDVAMPAVSYAPQALHIAGIMMRDARDPLTVTLPFKLTAYQVELFDTVSLTLSRYGWSAKTFMVTGREWAGDGSIKLTLKENVAATYTMDASFSAQGGADNTALPSPWLIDPPTLTGLSAGTKDLTSGADGRVLSTGVLTWSALGNLASQAGTIEVNWREPTDTAWQVVRVPGAASQATLSGLPDRRVVVLRARAISAMAVSNWSPHRYESTAANVLLVGAVRRGVLGDAVREWAYPGTDGRFYGSFSSTGEVAGAVELSSNTWSTATLWSNWTTWNGAATPASGTYTTGWLYINSTAVTATADVQIDCTGLYGVEVNTSDDGGATSTGWVALTQATPITCKYVAFRVTLTRSAAVPYPRMTRFMATLYAQARLETIEDWDIGTSPGRAGLGLAEIPTTLGLIRSLGLAITEDASGAWSWVIDKAAGGTYIQFLKNGAPADPYRVTFYIEGY